MWTLGVGEVGTGSGGLWLYSLDPSTHVWTPMAELVPEAGGSSGLQVHTPARMEGLSDGLYIEDMRGMWIWRGFLTTARPTTSDWFTHGTWFWTGPAQWHGRPWVAVGDALGNTIEPEFGDGTGVSLPYPDALVPVLTGPTETALVSFLVAEGVAATLWVRSEYVQGSAAAYAAAGLFTRTMFSGMAASTDTLDYWPLRTWADGRILYLLGWTPEGTVLEVLGEGLRLYSLTAEFADGHSGGNRPRLDALWAEYGRDRLWDNVSRLSTLTVEFADGHEGGNRPRLNVLGVTFSNGSGDGPAPTVTADGSSWLVSGAGLADYDGTYVLAGTFAGHDYYQMGTGDDARYLYWDTALGVWVLGSVLGGAPAYIDGTSLPGTWTAVIGGGGGPRLSWALVEYGAVAEVWDGTSRVRLSTLGVEYALATTTGPITPVPPGGGGTGELIALLLPRTLDETCFAVRVTPRLSIADAARCRCIVRADSEAQPDDSWGSYETFPAAVDYYLQRVGTVVRVGLIVPADLGHAPLFAVTYCS
jgi:hypothetical protein